MHQSNAKQSNDESRQPENTMHTSTNAKMNYKGVNYKLILDHPEANETATSWVTKLQSRCQRVVDLPPQKQKLFCKYLWSGQLNVGTSIDLGKISHKLAKSHTKNKPISLRMVGWKKVKKVAASEKFVDGSTADQCCCCTMKTHSIVFVVSLLMTAVAIILRCYNKSNWCDSLQNRRYDTIRDLVLCTSFQPWSFLPSTKPVAWLGFPRFLFFVYSTFVCAQHTYPGVSYR